jgi:hypothetical protein
LLYGKPYTSDPRLNPEEEKLERQNWYTQTGETKMTIQNYRNLQSN